MLTLLLIFPCVTRLVHTKMVKSLTSFRKGFANTTICPTFCACKPMKYLKTWGIKHDILKFIRDFGIVKASQKKP